MIETQQMKMKRKRRSMTKRKRKTVRQNTLFPLLLSAICSESPIRIALIKKCLSKLSLTLPHVHFSPILSLLPPLLKFDCAEIACKSAEFIGAASLESFEMNEMIAVEDETVKALVSLLRSPKREISMAACNAVLDLSTTSVGRKQLLEFPAIENLLLCFLKESKRQAATVCPAADMAFLEEDEYRILLLQGAITLINSCTIEQLHHIPEELSGKFSLHLKELWGQAYRKRLSSSSSKCDQENDFCISNIRTNNLVECIFRLSINCSHRGLVDFEHVKMSIFDLEEADIEPLLSEIWEKSPVLIRNGSKAPLKQDGIFCPFIRYLGSKETIPTNLPSLLKHIISCPAIASDEIDILNVIKEIKNHIGNPIIYHQDIRVVKTECRERELHYFQEHSDSTCSPSPHILTIDDMLKCEEAFNEGYSIALRGLEFRYQSIAAVADGLASLFGQPSAGVNMYLTPANSQGLARHSDDHCVFVCQIFGVKKWTVFPRPDFQLPRLYEPCDGLNESRDIEGCQQFLLKEGDVLYIPRGSPHEATTGVNDDENVNTPGFSLHLTLAIEIEPPFEWEGFMQVALYCWDKKQKAIQYKPGDSLSTNLHSVSVKLLQIAIKLIGNTSPIFRKACLIGAMLGSSNTQDNQIRKNQKTTFSHLISTIPADSKFPEVVDHLEAALEKNEDPLEHVRWMKYLTVEDEEIEGSDYWSISLQDRNMVEAGFMEVRLRFCDEVKFEDVEGVYLIMLEKYRKLRNQYTNGMLSLHSALQNEA